MNKNLTTQFIIGLGLFTIQVFIITLFATSGALPFEIQYTTIRFFLIAIGFGLMDLWAYAKYKTKSDKDA